VLLYFSLSHAMAVYDGFDLKEVGFALHIAFTDAQCRL
jgi:hypothetical protein